MTQYTAALPAQSAEGDTSTTVVATAQQDGDDGVTLGSVWLTPPAAYTTVDGAATNNVTFNVRQVRAGTSVGTVATLTLDAGVDLKAEVPVSVPVTVNETQVEAQDVFDVQMVQNGTGLAVGAGVLAQIVLI